MLGYFSDRFQLAYSRNGILRRMFFFEIEISFRNIGNHLRLLGRSRRHRTLHYKRRPSYQISIGRTSHKTIMSQPNSTGPEPGAQTLQQGMNAAPQQAGTATSSPAMDQSSNATSNNNPAQGISEQSRTMREPAAQTQQQTTDAAPQQAENEVDLGRMRTTTLPSMYNLLQ
jgi:hypothetical protein